MQRVTANASSPVNGIQQVSVVISPTERRPRPQWDAERGVVFHYRQARDKNEDPIYIDITTGPNGPGASPNRH